MGEWSIPRVCKTLARKGFESSNLSASILWEIVYIKVWRILEDAVRISNKQFPIISSQYIKKGIPKMFRSKIAEKSSKFFEIIIPNKYNEVPDSFGIYSQDVVEDVLKEFKEYISENLKRRILFESVRDSISEKAYLEVSGMSSREFYNKYNCDDYDVAEYSYLNAQIDERIDELWFGQFGDISEEEFDKKYSEIYAFEYFEIDAVPEIREVEIFSKI